MTFSNPPDMEQPDLSIIVPVYNEEGNAEPLYAAITREMAADRVATRERMQRIPRGWFGVRGSLDSRDTVASLSQFYWFYTVTQLSSD